MLPSFRKQKTAGNNKHSSKFSLDRSTLKTTDTGMSLTFLVYDYRVSCILRLADQPSNILRRNTDIGPELWKSTRKSKQKTSLEFWVFPKDYFWDPAFYWTDWVQLWKVPRQQSRVFIMTKQRDDSDWVTYGKQGIWIQVQLWPRHKLTEKTICLWLRRKWMNRLLKGLKGYLISTNK